MLNAQPASLAFAVDPVSLVMHESGPVALVAPSDPIVAFVVLLPGSIPHRGQIGDEEERAGIRVGEETIEHDLNLLF